MVSGVLQRPDNLNLHVQILAVAERRRAWVVPAAEFR
jgi:hypothetical protein